MPITFHDEIFFDLMWHCILSILYQTYEELLKEQINIMWEQNEWKFLFSLLETCRAPLEFICYINWYWYMSYKTSFEIYYQKDIKVISLLWISCYLSNLMHCLNAFSWNWKKTNKFHKQKILFYPIEIN